VVDRQYCISENPEVDIEVPGSRIRLALNPVVYETVAPRLAEAR